jgi:hypothetical protein
VQRLSATALITVAALLGSASAFAETERRALTTGEVETWLERPSGDQPKPGDLGVDEAAEAPPPPPRHHGIVVESGIGAFGHLGPLKHISPVSPAFSVRLGFEPLSFLLIFGEAEMSIANTSYATPPPPPRTYRMYNFGGGGRLTIPVGQLLGVFVEGSFGLSRISEDVLAVYGYLDANELNPYLGGRLGVEWYPTNPHLAFGLGGGVRSYNAGLKRQRSSDPALAWSVGPAIAYRF